MTNEIDNNTFKKYEMQTLMQLSSQMNTVLFKKFFKTLELPKGMKESHTMTIISINFNTNCSMSDLSHSLNMEKGSVTTIVDKLVNIDFITSIRSETDRRVYNLNLTPKGKEFAEEFLSKHRKYVGSLVGMLDENSRKIFVESSEALLEIIQKMHDFKI